MTIIGTKIPDVKDLLWKITLQAFNNKLLLNNLFSTEIGKLLIGKLELETEISKFQWNYKSNGSSNLLQSYFIPHFLVKCLNIVNSQFNKFSKLFEILENEILLSNNFTYRLKIPIFRVWFPENVKIINFDKNHHLRDIRDVKLPYGDKKPLNTFKNIPRSWSRFREEQPEASFEIEMKIPKRLNHEAAYEHNFTPTAPFNPLEGTNPILEKVRSLYAFFLTYNPLYSILPFTMGDKFFVVLPPFSLDHQDFTIYTYNEFPPPNGVLDLKTNNKLNDWKECWKNNYSDFYKRYYRWIKVDEDIRIFRYALEVLSIIHRIQYVKIKNFLIISTLEGLLFHKKIKKKLKITTNEKRRSVIHAFCKVCGDQKEYWQFIFQRNYPLKIKLNSFKTEKGLKELLGCAYDYRNNIAHPKRIKIIKIKPRSLRPPLSSESDEKLLEGIISRNFHLFILFLLKTWIKKKFNNVDEWMDYLLSIS